MSFNPINPKSDKHLTSPHGFTAESYNKITRIKEMILNLTKLYN